MVIKCNVKTVTFNFSVWIKSCYNFAGWSENVSHRSTFFVTWWVLYLSNAKKSKKIFPAVSS